MKKILQHYKRSHSVYWHNLPLLPVSPLAANKQENKKVIILFQYPYPS